MGLCRLLESELISVILLDCHTFREVCFIYPVSISMVQKTKSLEHCHFKTIFKLALKDCYVVSLVKIY